MCSGIRLARNPIIAPKAYCISPINDDATPVKWRSACCIAKAVKFPNKKPVDQIAKPKVKIYSINVGCPNKLLRHNPILASEKIPKPNFNIL